jgi:hypothetical protein
MQLIMPELLVFSLLRNLCLFSAGLNVRFAQESLFLFLRIHYPFCLEFTRGLQK